MTYLVSEIFLSLVGAAVIGGVIGWLLCKWVDGARRARQDSRDNR